MSINHVHALMPRRNLDVVTSTDRHTMHVPFIPIDHKEGALLYALFHDRWMPLCGI